MLSVHIHNIVLPHLLIAPSPVVGLSAVVLGSSSIQLSWNVPQFPNGPVGSYVIGIASISLDGSRPSVSQSVPIQFNSPVCVDWGLGLATNCSVPLAGLSPYTLYNFTITAVTFTDGLVGQPASVSAQTLEGRKSLGTVGY